ncbi:MarR family transcriptional regulator [Anaerococcus sp. AGMB00486]|uniref:HTH-type transcriptional regulator SarZ n=2 Tax=Anaerococcus TaxID=165779 RepID=A0ABX2N983_9FIRM|nr:MULTISPECIES: MarR family transcriptional regulator [Anaerococcus]MDY3005830.1 MarR family transcriptional regulator [Anaerococcus porci]MSS77571.1 MarR family transcriptional regulator [Anaerococcus porci]NVF11243.1 MarR family transcriptional regulator [Anaerococcus faecalis]
MTDRHIDFFEFNNSIFSMIREISHKIDLLLQETATDLGVTTLQLKMIMTLSASEDSVSIGNLGKSIGVNGGNISNICKKLEKQGFVDRNRSDEDERVVNVKLTQKGVDAADKVSEYFDKIKPEVDESNINTNLKTIINELESLDSLLDDYIIRSGL